MTLSTLIFLLDVLLAFTVGCLLGFGLDVDVLLAFAVGCLLGFGLNVLGLGEGGGGFVGVVLFLLELVRLEELELERESDKVDELELDGVGELRELGEDLG